MKVLRNGVMIFIVTTILTGLIYPAFITAVAQIFFRHQAQGSLVVHDGKIVGSSLIAQKFNKNIYFWPRPSAVNFETMPSGGSNLSATSKDLKDAVAKRRKDLIASDKTNPDKKIPSDMLYASGSGLDPHISPAAAMFQADRVAKARHMERAKVIGLIKDSTETKDLKVFGEERVNVLNLNLLLDSLGRK
jgi:K+-transporting ATPase ATPase C chain